MADRLLAEAVRLGGSLDALAALCAWARVHSEDLDCDPQVRRLLDAIAAELVGEGEVTPAGVAPVVGLGRAFLRQATDLIEDPGRSGGWDQVDPTLLQGIGRLSMSVAQAVQVVAQQVAGLGERLTSDGARILDVGTGAAWLAVALARTYPAAELVGIDVFEPVLEIARRNVAGEGLEERIELRLQDAAQLDEVAAYDVVWLPLPFLPKSLVPAVIAAAARALEPGGWLVTGMFTGSGGELSQLLTDLRTVRSGGHPWTSDELLPLLTEHGLDDVQEVPRTWAAPVRLHVGRATEG